VNEKSEANANPRMSDDAVRAKTGKTWKESLEKLIKYL
jgi:hypothetical protein